MVLLKTKSTHFNLLIRETSQFLCYERLLNMTYGAYKNAFFREMQFWSCCYTVVSYQALFRLSVYKIPAVYLSGAKNVCFCTIRDFGSPTKARVEASLLLRCILTGKQPNYYCDETKKMALNSQTVRAKMNPPQVKPRWAHPKTNTRQWPADENFLPLS